MLTLNEKIKKSKFTKLISALSEDDFKILADCLANRVAVREALRCYENTQNHTTQNAALAMEIKTRIDRR